MRRGIVSRAVPGRARIGRAQFRRTVLRASAGSFAWTGTSAGLRRGKIVVAGAGAFAWTGQSAGLVRGKLLAAGAGSFALTGTDAALRRGKSLVASPGSFALSGQSAGVLRTRRVAAAAGSFALTGTAATLTKVTAGKLIDTLTSIGLTTGLKLCLDAGDAASYTSGQSWLDRSGGGYDFFRGATSGAEGSDPTFNGSAGGLSSAEYFSFDGGDYFIYDSASETWQTNLYKDNAKLSLGMWVYFTTASATRGLIGQAPNTTSDVGFDFYVRSSNAARLLVRNGGTTVADLSTSGTPGSTTGGWMFLCASLDEAVGANGAFIGFGTSSLTYETFTSTYTSPATGAPTSVLSIGSLGGAGSITNAGTRIAEVMMWEGTVLSQSDFTAIYNATKGRFGL